MSIVTYARSSYMGTHKICSHRGMIEYMLGVTPPDDAYSRYGELNYMRAAKAATKGSAVHKALEIIAKRKLCIQENLSSFYDEELDTTFEKVDFKKLIELCINKYQWESQTPWSDWDKKNVRNWTWKVIKSDWNPSKLNIFAVEHFFDIEIEEDWAKYSYQIGDTLLEGNYRLRGTIDLIIDIGNNTLSIRDWKTGSKKKYNVRGQPDKTFIDLSEDHQFLLYYYVGKHLFPQHNIIVEVNYIKSDEISTLFMDDHSYHKSKSNIINFFKDIRQSYPPPLIKYTNDEPCGFCPWSQLKERDRSLNDCSFFEKQANEKSANELLLEFGSISKMSQYQGGGAQRDLSKKE